MKAKVSKARKAAIVWRYVVSLFVLAIGCKCSDWVMILGIGMVLASTGYTLLAVSDMDEK